MKTKDLTSGPIGKELLLLALPLTLANIVNIAYNMIDMYYIGQVGGDALSAVGTAGFYLWLAASIVFFSKQGMEILISQAIGAGNIDKSRDIIKTGVILNLAIAMCYAIIVYLLADNLIGFFKLDSNLIHDLGVEYLQIVSVAIFFMMINQNLMSIFQARGQTSKVLLFNGIGLIVNIVLDPILILDLQLEVAGAALATAIANCLVFILSVFSLRNFERNFKRKMHFSKSIAFKIMRLSFPTGCYQVFYTIIAMFVSGYAISYGDDVMAAQRIGSEIESLSWMMASGLSIATGVFTGQNVGAQNKGRIDVAFRYLFNFSIIYGTFLLLLFVFGGQQIIMLFSTDPTIVAIGTDYLFYLAFCQVFTLLEGVIAGYFNGYGKTHLASFFSISGNVLKVIMVIPFSIVFGLNGIWLVISISGIYRGLGLLICKSYYERRGLLGFNT